MKTDLNKLPEMCWVEKMGSDELVLVKRGEMGYYPQGNDVLPYTLENKESLNKQLGVTVAQELAMQAGSMFGWDTPGSDPDNWTEDGMFIGTHLKEND